MIEIKNVTAGYGKKTVLQNVSLTACEGKTMAIIGPNGSGKSTLLKVIAGILPTTSGTVVADGTQIGKASPTDAAKKIAYLPQEKNVPDMTVAETVLHGRFPHLSYPRRYTQRDRELTRQAMEKIGILHLADKNMSQLSGGMKQSVYIAMALCQDTDYILLDEPAVYLDIANQFTLIRLLKELASGRKGIVAVMHDIPTAFDCFDEIAVMSNGVCVMQDTPEKVCGSGIVSELFGADLIKSQQGYIIKEKLK